MGFLGLKSGLGNYGLFGISAGSISLAGSIGFEPGFWPVQLV